MENLNVSWSPHFKSSSNYNGKYVEFNNSSKVKQSTDNITSFGSSQEYYQKQKLHMDITLGQSQNPQMNSKIQCKNKSFLPSQSNNNYYTKYHDVSTSASSAHSNKENNVSSASRVSDISQANNILLPAQNMPASNASVILNTRQAYPVNNPGLPIYYQENHSQGLHNMPTSRQSSGFASSVNSNNVTGFNPNKCSSTVNSSLPNAYKNQSNSSSAHPHFQSTDIGLNNRQSTDNMQGLFSGANIDNYSTIPDFIHLTDEDNKKNGGIFSTEKKAVVPPLITTSFVVQDKGNCSPRFMSSTIYNVPRLPELLKKTSLPFAVVVSPLARITDGEVDPPLCNRNLSGPVRCIRCRAYMCPFMRFFEGGGRFQCAFCKGITEVPDQYFSYLDSTGQRIDKYNRPELHLGSYEFLGNETYCRDNEIPKPPVFVFVIDVSAAALKCGMVHLLCENMKKILTNLPKDDSEKTSSIKVAFITYSNVVHFYNLQGPLCRPQMMIAPDVHDVFVPLVNSLLVRPNEAEDVINSLMKLIPSLFNDASNEGTILGPAIDAALKAIKESGCVGKIFVFHTSLPSADAPGKLINRQSDKETFSQTTYYTKLAEDCSAAGCGVDLFLFPNSYIDVATIGVLSKLTGGQVYKYMYFQLERDGQRFIEDLGQNVQKSGAFDAICRIRTSAGISPTHYYGNFSMTNSTDIEFAFIDSEKSFAVDIEYDEKLESEETIFLQAALLYTSCSGKRKIRIHNLSIPTCSNINDIYANCYVNSLVNYFAKAALNQLNVQSQKDVKESMIQRSVNILCCFRKNSPNHFASSNIVLPNRLRLLPLYINCLLRCDAIGGGNEIALDDRSFALIYVNSMDLRNITIYVYPRLLPLHNVDVNSSDIPKCIRCSNTEIEDNGAYLLENGVYMFLWVGSKISIQWLQEVFGVNCTSEINIHKPFHEYSTPLSKRIAGIIKEVLQNRDYQMRPIIVRPGDKLNVLFRYFLVEDEINDNTSYIDFLVNLHRRVVSLLA